MSRNSTFVLAPGYFLPPSYYDSTAKLLEYHGSQTHIVPIPSTGSKLHFTSNELDIVLVQDFLENLSSSGKEIIVVALLWQHPHLQSCEKPWESGKSTAGVGSGMFTNRRRESTEYH